MGNSRVEITVGLFLVMGFLALGWLALQLGEVPWLTEAKTYTLNAEFSNISGLRIEPNTDIDPHLARAAALARELMRAG